ncbi:MAG: hypothetical protein QMC90_02065 [Dehalococcoidales bacterium]|nr:hypothetical protein [Dehalococcoidales bacterium]
MANYWMAVGSPGNWKEAFEKGNIWGLTQRQKHRWENLTENDIILFYVTETVAGIIGYGSARFEIIRRQLSEEVVRSVAQNPQQVVKLKKERKVCQSKYYDSNEGREMLLRVICEERRDLLFVVTVYRTSKIEKYWE